MLFLLWMEFLGVSLEEIRGFHRFGARNGLESESRNVIGLAFLHQRIIFEQILLLRVIALGLVLEHSFGFTSVVIMICQFSTIYISLSLMWTVCGRIHTEKCLQTSSQCRVQSLPRLRVRLPWSTWVLEGIVSILSRSIAMEDEPVSTISCPRCISSNPCGPWPTSTKAAA